MKRTIIVAIVLLNIFLLYTNIQRQNRVNILTGQLAVCEQQSIRHTQTSTVIQIPVSLINHENSLSLITFFTERGCSPCVIEEIIHLNEIYPRYEQLIDIYLIGGSSGYLTQLGAAFAYRNVEDIPDFGNIHIDNPVSFLIDRNNTIQLIHKAEIGNPEKSRLFFERVESIFESVYGYYYLNNSGEFKDKMKLLLELDIAGSSNK